MLDREPPRLPAVEYLLTIIKLLLLTWFHCQQRWKKLLACHIISVDGLSDTWVINGKSNQVALEAVMHKCIRSAKRWCCKSCWHAIISVRMDSVLFGSSRASAMKKFPRRRCTGTFHTWLVNSPSTWGRLGYHGVWIRDPPFLPRVKELLLLC